MKQMNDPAKTISRTEAEELLYREARLLDTMQLREWLGLYAPDGLYWIPIDETQPAKRTASLVHDDTPSREERVYHLEQLPFPAQNPRSRTVHMVSNIEVLGLDEDGSTRVASSQVIYETRTGDYTQIGLGEISTIVASVEYRLVRLQGVIKIKLKKILLINREMPQGNMTFIV